MLVPEVNPCAALFGDEVTTYGFIERAVKEADADPEVKEIFLAIDSGGGYVTGVEEAGRAISSAKKPTTTLAGDTVGSAAYWLAACADTIVATQKTGFFGSIGVVTEFIDRSKADAAQGYTRYSITNQASKDKRPNLATEEGQAVLLDELDALYSEFKNTVLSKRSAKLTSESIDALTGRMFIAEKALSLGLVDKIASREDLLKSDSSVTIVNVRSSACAETNKIGGNSMNLKEFLDSEPKAQAEYEKALAEAKATEKAKAEESNKAYSADVLKIVELSGGTLNKVALASIEKGETPAQFALAEMESHKEAGKPTDAGTVKAKTEIVTEAKTEDSRAAKMDAFYDKRAEAIKGRVK